jgi:hypothetical protein
MAIIRKSKKINKYKSKRSRNINFLKRLRRSSRIKYLKRGGGYIASLSINKPLLMILMTPALNADTSLIFSITNQATQETIHYNNIRCLGKGTYGKVFLISNDGKKSDPFVFGIHIYLFLVITFFVISLLGTCISCGHWLAVSAWYESDMHNSDIP